MLIISPIFGVKITKKWNHQLVFLASPPKPRKNVLGDQNWFLTCPKTYKKIDTIPTISTFKACNFCFKLRSGKAPSIQPLIHPAQNRHPGIIQRTMDKQLGLCVWNLETMLKDRLMWYGWWFRNPKQPVDMVNIALFRRFYICQVVKDFFHRQYGQQLFGIMFFLCLPLRESDILSLSLKVLSWGFTWNQKKSPNSKRKITWTKPPSLGSSRYFSSVYSEKKVRSHPRKLPLKLGGETSEDLASDNWVPAPGVPFEGGERFNFGRVPSRELTFPTLGKGKPSSKLTFQGIC